MTIWWAALKIIAPLIYLYMLEYSARLVKKKGFYIFAPFPEMLDRAAAHTEKLIKCFDLLTNERNAAMFII